MSDDEVAERPVGSRRLTALVGVRLLPGEHEAGLAAARSVHLSLPALMRQLLVSYLIQRKGFER